MLRVEASTCNGVRRNDLVLLTLRPRFRPPCARLLLLASLASSSSQRAPFVVFATSPAPPSGSEPLLPEAPARDVLDGGNEADEAASRARSIGPLSRLEFVL